jgi:Ran GTPase-activating protein (RanGAP) involved in mRNA processing and transport
LQELELARNDAGDEGTNAIAEALRRNETLKRLDLSSNSISEAGAMAILKALTERNCSLTWLNLECNPEVSPGLQNDIGFVLASRRMLNPFATAFASRWTRS